MNIFCEECGKNMATVFLTRISQDDVSKIQLCEECARRIEAMSGGAELVTAVPQMIAEYMAAMAEDHDSIEELEEEPLVCSGCGTSSSDFRKMGLLGCPECYRVFGSAIEGIFGELSTGVEHRGKLPKNVSERARLRRRLVDLELDLERRVSEEKYESAAQVRDKIRELREKLASCEPRGEFEDE